MATIHLEFVCRFCKKIDHSEDWNATECKKCSKLVEEKHREQSIKIKAELDAFRKLNADQIIRYVVIDDIHLNDQGYTYEWKGEIGKGKFEFVKFMNRKGYKFTHFCERWDEPNFAGLYRMKDGKNCIRYESQKINDLYSN